MFGVHPHRPGLRGLAGDGGQTNVRGARRFLIDQGGATKGRCRTGSGGPGRTKAGARKRGHRAARIAVEHTHETFRKCVLDAPRNRGCRRALQGSPESCGGDGRGQPASRTRARPANELDEDPGRGRRRHEVEVEKGTLWGIGCQAGSTRNPLPNWKWILGKQSP